MGNQTTTPPIKYPYLPVGRQVRYVDMDNQYMQAAKAFAREHSLDTAMPNSSIIVKDGAIIGEGANGSTYHQTHECERVKRNIPSGQGYELCEGCHPKNHGEPKAIADAIKKGNQQLLAGADLYLWGHWWCCKPCWETMTKAGIRNVYLLTNSEKLFDKTHPDNVVGRQFDDPGA